MIRRQQAYKQRQSTSPLYLSASSTRDASTKLPDSRISLTSRFASCTPNNGQNLRTEKKRLGLLTKTADCDEGCNMK